MKLTHRAPKSVLLVLLLSASISLGCAASPPAGEPTVFLIRHAEAANDGTRDPPLTAAGQRRARCWAETLADRGIERVWTSDYQRTRQTAAPVARRLGVTPQTYDAGALAAFAAQLRQQGQTVLVVGHSNTTPQLAAALDADPGEPIGHHEHGRLYQISGKDARITRGLCAPD